MGNCKDCKHWNVSIITNARCCGYDGLDFHGRIKESGMAAHADAINISYEEIRTGPLFGCVNFQQRENNLMRYKVMHKSDIAAVFETAQCAGDYLFTIPAEKISEFYIHDTKENVAFPFCSYKYEWGNLVGTYHTALADVLKTLKQGK